MIHTGGDVSFIQVAIGFLPNGVELSTSVRSHLRGRSAHTLLVIPCRPLSNERTGMS